MRIRIIDSNNKILGEGDYLYLEGNKYDGKITFHFQLTKDGKDIEIHFETKSEEDISGIINELKDILEGRQFE